MALVRGRKTIELPAIRAPETVVPQLREWKRKLEDAIRTVTVDAGAIAEGAVLRDGTQNLTADWNAGNYTITSKYLAASDAITLTGKVRLTTADFLGVTYPAIQFWNHRTGAWGAILREGPGTYQGLSLIGSDGSVATFSAAYIGAYKQIYLVTENGTDAQISCTQTGVGMIALNVSVTEGCNLSSSIQELKIKTTANASATLLYIEDNISPNFNKTTISGTYVSTQRFVSTIAIGTMPIDVTSTTLCQNLNADMVDGKHVSELTDADTLDGYDSGDFAYSEHSHDFDELGNADVDDDEISALGEYALTYHKDLNGDLEVAGFELHIFDSNGDIMPREQSLLSVGIKDYFFEVDSNLDIMPI